MYLRSIILKGFKSFPDRTRLEFGPGVSVIVGPNGSGKSNVTDAVLWALGEQSAAAVRGQVMQDVIFAGAPGRQASQAAEVELVLEDPEGRLGLGTSEISVLRRLDRRGEGEYRMAGARCRLVDVIELLSDTGLGKEMHSVISQGRVESIITSKPRDRRLLIEEAAGLGKHRKRRRRAQLKLERTQDNLDRALDVEREARSRLRPLKRQAEAAELHARLERQSLQARWELARDDLRSHLEVLEHARSHAASARTRREQVERELEAVARRREAAEEALAARSAERDRLSRRSFAAQSAADRVSFRAEAVRGSLSVIEARVRRAEQQLESLNQALEQEPPDPGHAERIASLREELAAVEREREQETERAVAELESRHSALQSRAAEQEQAVEAAQRSRNDAAQGLESAREVVQQAEHAVEQARLEAARIGGELAAVNQFLRSLATVPGGSPVLADQLEVDPGFELAVAAALDGRLGAAVVGDLEAADDLLDRVGAEGGRALITDLAAQVQDGRTGPGGGSPAAGAELLSDHVHGSGQAAALARGLLRDTWLVDALQKVDSGFRGTAVTRDGRVLSTSAAELRQAPAIGDERVLAQRNLRERLIAESERAAGAEVSAGARLQDAAAAQTVARSALEQAVTVHRRAISARDETLEDGRRIAALIERRRSAVDEGPGDDRRRGLLAELRAEQDALARLEQEHAQRESHVERLRGTIDAGSALLPRVRGLLDALEGVGQAIAAQRATFEEALAADQEAAEHVAAELRGCAQEEAPLQAQLHRAAEELTEAEVALQRGRDRSEESERELGRLAVQLGLEATPGEAELSAQERETLASRLERLTRRREQLGPVNPLAGQEYEEALAHVEELERQRTDLETALRELEKLISDTDRQIRDTFEQTFQAAAANFEHVVAELFPGGRGRLRLVSERDGPARMLGRQAADADGDEEQADDLPAADEDLQGVEIEINPAGKEMRRLSLLSGGEKSLTALAFLFAVFLARPCPFYILDEVEAALDDLNIDRFLALLRAYSERAQFIVVTHQRRTMEAADFLYGVSMGGDGLSKVISRRLPSAEAESAPGEAQEPTGPDTSQTEAAA